MQGGFREPELFRELRINFQCDEWNLYIVVEGQLILPDDVDIGLSEFSIASVLRTLPSPDFLNLVTTEREHHLTRIFQDVPREGDGQIEV